jgi:hypothetical protein
LERIGKEAVGKYFKALFHIKGQRSNTGENKNLNKSTFIILFPISSLAADGRMET